METFISIVERDFLQWALMHGVRLLIIIVGSWTVYRFGAGFIVRMLERALYDGRSVSLEATRKRKETLSKVLENTVKVVMVLMGGLMALSEVGVNVGPMIAAAGVAGLAFGFGGQYLIRDIISGLFILVENQYRVGDVVCLGDTCGLVESINLRLTVLRDLDGTVHHVPNGEVKVASNLSKYFSRVNLNIGVSYSTDLEKVIEVVNRVGNEMSEDPAWKDMILSPPQFLRVDDFADSAVIVKILGDTKPLKQWDVTGELRKRIKIAFDREGIEIPFPQRVVHMPASINKV